MSPMSFHRVTVLETNEKGWLNKMMPQGDDTFLYEVFGDSGRLYILQENEFYYGTNEVEDEPKWEG
jgi:hypothetical protein